MNESQWVDAREAAINAVTEVLVEAELHRGDVIEGFDLLDEASARLLAELVVDRVMGEVLTRTEGYLKGLDDAVEIVYSHMPGIGAVLYDVRNDIVARQKEAKRLQQEGEA